MGQRTQVIVNIEVVDEKGVKSVEREMLHYQWGGFNNIMFLSLKNFFTNVKLFIGGLNNKDLSFNYEKNKRYNILKNNLMNVLKNSFSTFENLFEIKGDELLKVEKKEFYLEDIDYADCDNGQILVDLYINMQTNEKYCKWAFLEVGTEKDISNSFIEIEELKRVWNLKEKDFKKIMKVVKEINKEEIFVDAGNGYLEAPEIEYDKKHFENIFY